MSNRRIYIQLRRARRLVGDLAFSLFVPVRILRGCSSAGARGWVVAAVLWLVLLFVLLVLWNLKMRSVPIAELPGF